MALPPGATLKGHSTMGQVLVGYSVADKQIRPPQLQQQPTMSVPAVPPMMAVRPQVTEVLAPLALRAPPTVQERILALRQRRFNEQALGASERRASHKRQRDAAAASCCLGESLEKRFPRQAAQAERLRRLEEDLDRKINRHRRALLVALDDVRWVRKYVRVWLTLSIEGGAPATAGGGGGDSDDSGGGGHSGSSAGGGGVAEKGGKPAPAAGVPGNDNIGNNGASGISASPAPMDISDPVAWAAAGAPPGAAGGPLGTAEATPPATAAAPAAPEPHLLLRVEGRLLNPPPGPGEPPLFTSFFSRISVQMDRRGDPGGSLAWAWVRTPGCQDTDGIELRRPLTDLSGAAMAVATPGGAGGTAAAGKGSRGAGRVTVRVQLHRRNDGGRPERVAPSPALRAALRLPPAEEKRDDARPIIVAAIRNYALRQRLFDPHNPGKVSCDEALESLVGARWGDFAAIVDALANRGHLPPADSPQLEVSAGAASLLRIAAAGCSAGSGGLAAPRVRQRTVDVEIDAEDPARAAALDALEALDAVDAAALRADHSAGAEERALDRQVAALAAAAGAGARRTDFLRSFAEDPAAFVARLVRQRAADGERRRAAAGEDGPLAGVAWRRDACEAVAAESAARVAAAPVLAGLEPAKPLSTTAKYQYGIGGIGGIGGVSGGSNAGIGGGGVGIGVGGGDGDSFSICGRSGIGQLGAGGGMGVGGISSALYSGATGVAALGGVMMPDVGGGGAYSGAIGFVAASGEPPVRL